jgi:hypothetical protein
MKTHRNKFFGISLAGALLLGLTLNFSGGQTLAAEAIDLDISICDPSAGPFSADINHPYLPYAVGHTLVLKGVEDEVDVRLRLTVLNETEVVAGVTTRVVEERAWEDGELHELARNFFAQTADGTVCYYGEDVNFYEEGEVVSHEGAWRAGEGENRPGIMMPGSPAVGMAYAQEVAPGVSEDQAEIVSMGERVTVRGGTFENTLLTRETSPLDPGVAAFKVYAPGVGLIVDDVLELVRIGTNDDDNDDDDDDHDDEVEDDHDDDDHDDADDE